MNAWKVLIVDDEPAICEMLRFIMEEAGYEVHTESRGDTVLDHCGAWRPDIVVLDIGLPGKNGYDVCRELTKEGIPFIVLSSYDKDYQVIKGLELGAEDYVAKPFNYKELVLRVQKVIHRTSPRAQLPEEIVLGDLKVDFSGQEVAIGSVPVSLTPTEYRIVEILARHAHVPVSTETLLQEVWNSTKERESAVEMIKVNICRLRKKLEQDPANPRYLLTKWGFGYILTDTSVRPSEDGSAL